MSGPSGVPPDPGLSLSLWRRRDGSRAISACALFTGGDLRCWGRNFAGQLGNGEVTQEPVPVPVEPTGDHNWTAVDLGEYNTCGIAESITYCWGDNANGTLGDGTDDNRSVPTAVVGQM